jgi:hypothetical protein
MPKEVLAEKPVKEQLAKDPVAAVGLRVTVAGKSFTLSPTEAARKAAAAADSFAAYIKEHGIEIELPPNVEVPLATVAGCLAPLKTLGLNIPTTDDELKDVPAWLKDGFQGVLNKQIVVYDFHLKWNGKEEPKNLFRIGVYLAVGLKAPGGLPLALDGISFSVEKKF